MTTPAKPANATNPHMVSPAQVMADRARIARDYERISQAFKAGMITNEQRRKMLTQLLGHDPDTAN